MRDPWPDRLSDYLDGELSPHEESRCRRHLDSCPDCRRDLSELQRVKRWAARHKPRTPAPDPWPEIRRRIIEARRPFEAAPPVVGRASRRLHHASWLGAAAGIFLIVAVALLWRWQQPKVPVAPPPQARSAALAEEARMWGQAAAELERELESRKRLLDPATRADLEKSLTVLDDFASELRRRIEEDPDNKLLREFLARSLHMRLIALRQAGRLSMNTS